MSDDLKKLQKEWYLKLQESGFIDIEQTEKEHSPFKDWHSLKFRKVSIDRKEETEEYYARARALLWSHPFQDELHKKIWAYHSEGFSKRQIEKRVNGKLKREAIGNFITQIAASIKS